MKDLDWSNLSFGYRRTDYNVRCYYRDGKWGEIEVCSDEYLKLHMAATCLHYGQEAFEGLKAYRCPEGGSPQPGVDSYLREWCYPVHPSSLDWYKRSGGCSPS